LLSYFIGKHRKTTKRKGTKMTKQNGENIMTVHEYLRNCESSHENYEERWVEDPYINLPSQVALDIIDDSDYATFFATFGEAENFARDWRDDFVTLTRVNRFTNAEERVLQGDLADFWDYSIFKHAITNKFIVIASCSNDPNTQNDFFSGDHVLKIEDDGSVSRNAISQDPYEWEDYHYGDEETATGLEMDRSEIPKG
jgi:hypothetical protein